MAQTLTRMLMHIVFSTKHRHNLVAPAIEDELYRYSSAICRTLESPLLTMGGTANHVHLLVNLSKNIALRDLLMTLKKDTSKWIKTKGAAFDDFHWQDGYSAFSIGESQEKAVTQYIARQKTHHGAVTFEDELVAFLRRYGVEFDPRYVFD